MKNFITEGEIIKATAPSGGVVSGQLVLIGLVAAVALMSAAEGEEYTAQTVGVFEIAKETGAVTIGQALFLTSSKTVTTDPDGNDFVGYAYEAALSAGLTAKVLLVQKTPITVAANVAKVTAVDATDLTTSQALAIANKTAINALITSLVAAGYIAAAE